MVGVEVVVGLGVAVGVLVFGGPGAGVARTAYSRSSWTLSPHQKVFELTAEHIVPRLGTGSPGCRQYALSVHPSLWQISNTWRNPGIPGIDSNPPIWHTDQPFTGQLLCRSALGSPGKRGGDEWAGVQASKEAPQINRIVAKIKRVRFNAASWMLNAGGAS
jgi:hypothetical protein